jgi:hypothetical protein
MGRDGGQWCDGRSGPAARRRRRRSLRDALVSPFVAGAIERLGASLATLTFGAPGEAAPTVVLELTHAAEDGRPSITSTTTPPKGKPRIKVETLKKPLPNGEWHTNSLIDKAVLAALKKGLVGVSATPGAPDLILLTKIGPPMSEAFAVDEARGAAWLGDWGQLRRVDLGTGAVTSTPLGERPAVSDMAVAPDGAVWLLADYDDVQPDGQFRAPTVGKKQRFALLRYDGTALETRFAFVEGQVRRVQLTLSIGCDGTLLVPHAEGVARARLDGTVIQVYGTDAPEPQAVLSPTGRWVATTPTQGEVAVHDTHSGTVARHRLDLDLDFLAVRDDGAIDVAANTPRTVFQRIALSGEAQSVKPHAPRYPHRFAASPDGMTLFTSDTYGLCAWNLGGEQLAWVTLIGGHKESRVAVTERAIYGRTYGGVFQRIARSVAA